MGGTFSQLCRRYLPFFSRKGVIIIYKTLEDVKQIYKEEDLVKIVNLKQILFYSKNGIQPVFIDEGFSNKIVCYYVKDHTHDVFFKWKNNKPAPDKQGSLTSIK